LLLQHQDILRTQLRAFLRVSGKHPISILLPMVGGVDDVRAVRAVIAAVQRELIADGHPVDDGTPIGAMIEVPAAALLARDLAHHVDFFSLGTNDLVQYLLAADREDETVTSYYQPLHPAVLRLIRSIAEVAEQTGRELTLCGEMAGDARYTALLLGLGLRSFSVAPGELLAVKRAIRGVTLADAEALARRVLALSSAAEIETLVSPQTTGAPDEAPMKVAPLLIAQ
jgi:phosphotransferase system enzyme I (PtsI)